MNTNGAHSRTYAIIGAGGRIGQKIACSLLSKGHQVKAIDIDGGKISKMVAKGAAPFLGTITDTVFLQHALKGADAAFTLVPQLKQSEDYIGFQEAAAFSMAKAIRGAGIQQVVNLSILSADVSAAPLTFKKLHEFELLLEGIPGLNVTHLRATYFMENLLLGIDTITQAKMYGLPLQPNLAMPFIATEDVASVAVQLLHSFSIEGIQVRNLLGQRHLNMEEVTEILRHKLHLPDLLYLYMPYSDAHRSMVRHGWSENLADIYIDIYQKINEGLVISNVIRKKNTTTPTSIEDFIESQIVPIYSANRLGKNF